MANQTVLCYVDFYTENGKVLQKNKEIIEALFCELNNNILYLPSSMIDNSTTIFFSFVHDLKSELFTYEVK